MKIANSTNIQNKKKKFIVILTKINFLFIIRLDTAETQCICVSVFFFFIEKHVSILFSGSCVLFKDSQILFFNKIFIKNWSYSTIYTFKNYFVIIFSVFNLQFLVK